MGGLAVTTKRCSLCGWDKPADLEHFFLDRHVSSGLKGRCRKCTNDARMGRPIFKRTPDPTAATTPLEEHIETWRLIGVHRAMDVFPNRCHYHFGTVNPCMDDHVPGSTYCAKHRDSEALKAGRQGRGDDEPPAE